MDLCCTAFWQVALSPTAVGAAGEKAGAGGTPHPAMYDVACFQTKQSQ